MTNITIVDETNMSADDARIFLAAVNYFVPLVTKAWKLPAVTVKWADKTSVTNSTDWLIFLTERNKRSNVKGFHTTSISGTPIAFCSFNAVGKNLFGRYHRPLAVKGKVFGVAKFLSEGLITTVCHEIAEMLCDPKIESLSPKDSLGRNWLVEIADPVAGSYLLYTDVKTQTDITLPDIVTPSFYSITGTSPFSLAHAISSPFTLLKPKGYAYEKNNVGKLTPIK